LPNYLALLVRCKERDIGCVTAASYPDDTFDRSEPCVVDEPLAVFDIDVEDGVVIGRIQLEGVGADGSGGVPNALANVMPSLVANLEMLSP
jgi:hypothetical protein